MLRYNTTPITLMLRYNLLTQTTQHERTRKRIEESFLPGTLSDDARHRIEGQPKNSPSNQISKLTLKPYMKLK